MGRGGVDPIGHTAELHALALKLTDQIDQPFDRATEAIELLDDKDIALTQVGLGLTEARMVSFGC